MGEYGSPGADANPLQDPIFINPNVQIGQKTIVDDIRGMKMPDAVEIDHGCLGIGQRWYFSMP
jgi:hypothetical protein